MTPKFTDNETLGRFLGDATPVQPEELRAAMAVRDLMSATQTLSEMASRKSEHWLVSVEANDIELAYTRLGRLLSQVRKSQESICAA
jgi:hypothetical protein